MPGVLARRHAGDCATLAADVRPRRPLAARTLELVNIPSESRGEAEIAAHVRSLVPPSFELEYEGDDAFVWARPRSADARSSCSPATTTRCLLRRTSPGRIENGTVVGLGASDMKGGLAVMLELARAGARRDEPAVDVALLAFGKEELPAEFSPLPDLFDRSRLVARGRAGVLLEPTDNTIQAGCLGNLNARITSAASAGTPPGPGRPRTPSTRRSTASAPTPRSSPGRRDRRPHVHGGREHHPDRRRNRKQCDPRPGRGERELPLRARSLASRRERLPPQPVPAGRPTSTPATLPRPGCATSPLVHRLRAAGDLALEPKQAWTNVADFTSRGIDAVNFGPGATRYAHRRDEQVEIAALERAFESLWAFVTGTV